MARGSSTSWNDEPHGSVIAIEPPPGVTSNSKQLESRTGSRPSIRFKTGSRLLYAKVTTPRAPDVNGYQRIIFVNRL